jgi:alpha-N-arabinofuranosidase
MQELDLGLGKLVGDRKQLTHGHASNAIWSEGPHLFKIGGKYVLIIAEGGTDFTHAVTIHQSDSLWGPYIPNQVNPVITHRHLGKDYPVWAVGHADLVQTQTGDWWSVMLAKRRVDGYTLLGRESFLAKVDFEEQEGVLNPVFNRGQGRLLSEQIRPDLPWSPVPPLPRRDEFEGEHLELYWNFLRSPLTRWWQLNQGVLELEVRPESVGRPGNPTLVARRILDHNFDAATSLSFMSGKENEQAGITLYRTDLNHFLLLKEKTELVLIRVREGHRETLARTPWTEKEVILGVEARGVEVQFKFGATADQLEPIGPAVSMSLLSDEMAWGFNGPYIGMYATSNGADSKARAAYEWFFYRGLD